MIALSMTMDQVTEGVARLYWPFVRIAGVLSVAPIIGSPLIPVRIRVALAVLLTLSVLSLTGETPSVDPLSLAGVIVTINQLIVGLVIGFTLLLVFNVINVAGESISATMGLSFALMSDPSSNVQVPIVSQFLTILATLIFLSLDGHHALINMIVESFNVVPISEKIAPDGYWQLVQWSAVLFKGAVMLALPALVTMLCINVIMAVMTRSAPQLNIFSVGFPITMVVGFLVIMLTLPGLVPGFTDLVVRGFEAMGVILHGVSA